MEHAAVVRSPEVPCGRPAAPRPGATTVALRPLRRLGAAMLALALVRPLLPGAPGLPCPLRALTGVPCPLCGMTTSVTDAVHLRVPEALASNPAGVPLVLGAVALLVLPRRVSMSVPSWAPAGALATVAAVWASQVWRLTGA